MLLKVESYKKGAFLSTIFNIVNKGLVFCNSLIIAFFFGAQLKMDIYFYAYNTIVILSTFITSLNASVLIPESMRLRAQSGEKEAVRFLNYFFYLHIALMGLISILFIINPVEAFNTVSGFKRGALEEQVMILRLSIPLIFLMPIINLLTDIMTSYKFFTIPMIAGIVNGIFSMLFVVFFHKILDVSSMLVGLLISYSLNFILLLSLMRRRLHWDFSFHRMRIERRIWKNIAFAQAGNITSSLTSYAPLYLLSSFGNGIITSLTFAQQISTLPTTLITNQFSAVAGIKFNESYAKKDYGEVNKTFLSTANFLLFILIPVAFILFLYSSEIVSVVLERGAFGKKSVIYTSQFLKYLGLLLPLMVINTLFARLFMASHKIIESFWYQICFNIILIVAFYINLRQFGFVAYPITLVSGYLLNVLLSYFLEKRYFNIIQYDIVLKKMFILILINLTVGECVYLFVHYTIHSAFLSLAVGSSLYLALIVLIGLRFNLNDIFNSFIYNFWKKGLSYGRFKNP